MKQNLFLPLLTYPAATSEFMIANAVAFARHMATALSRKLASTLTRWGEDRPRRELTNASMAAKTALHQVCGNVYRRTSHFLATRHAIV